MRGTLILLVLFIVVSLVNCSPTNEEIIKKTADNLNDLKTAEYTSTIHYLQHEMGYNEFDTAQCFFDFTGKDSILGARYHIIKQDSNKRVYSGNQLFRIEKDNNRIIFYNNNFGKKRVFGSFFMQFSLWELRNILPVFIEDTSIQITREEDTVINSKSSYYFHIEIPGRFIKWGKLIKGDHENYHYEMAISKKDYMLVKFAYIFPEGAGHWKTKYDEINSSAERSDSIWNYSKYPERFERLTFQDFIQRHKNSLRTGEKAPEWVLPLVNGDKLKLSDIKGNLILLEFWFPHCRGCVRAISHLNKLQAKYKDEGLIIYGIEMQGAKRKYIKEYMKEQNMKYPSLLKGKEVANAYGINVAPSFFLIDNNGKIIYKSTGLNREKLVSVIEKHLE